MENNRSDNRCLRVLVGVAMLAVVVFCFVDLILSSMRIHSMANLDVNLGGKLTIQIFMLINGILALLLGAFGLYATLLGSAAELRWLFYLGMGLLVYCSLVTLAALIPIGFGSLEADYERIFTPIFRNYINGSDLHLKQEWDKIQRDYHCCGLKKVDDYKLMGWEKNPESCPDYENNRFEELLKAGCATRFTWEDYVRRFSFLGDLFGLLILSCLLCCQYSSLTDAHPTPSYNNTQWPPQMVPPQMVPQAQPQMAYSMAPPQLMAKHSSPPPPPPPQSNADSPQQPKKHHDSNVKSDAIESKAGSAKKAAN